MNNDQLESTIKDLEYQLNLHKETTICLICHCSECEAGGCLESAIEVANDLLRERAKRSELQAIVDKLPRTKDGVSIAPGDMIHIEPGCDAVVERIVWSDEDGWCFEKAEQTLSFVISKCYSTKQAALDAHKGENK